MGGRGGRDHAEEILAVIARAYCRGAHRRRIIPQPRARGRGYLAAVVIVVDGFDVFLDRLETFLVISRGSIGGITVVGVAIIVIVVGLFLFLETIFMRLDLNSLRCSALHCRRTAATAIRVGGCRGRRVVRSVRRGRRCHRGTVSRVIGRATRRGMIIP